MLQAIRNNSTARIATNTHLPCWKRTSADLKEATDLIVLRCSASSSYGGLCAYSILTDRSNSPGTYSASNAYAWVGIPSKVDWSRTSTCACLRASNSTASDSSWRVSVGKRNRLCHFL